MPYGEAALCLSICAVPVIGLIVCLFWNWKAGTFTYQVRERQAMEAYEQAISKLIEDSALHDTGEVFEEVS
jgi:hypothetical protein